MRRWTAGSVPEIPYWDDSYFSKAASRARVMTPDAIYGWIGSAVSGMYKAMQDYRKDGQPEALQEMQEGLVAAYALMAELRARQDAASR